MAATTLIRAFAATLVPALLVVAFAGSASARSSTVRFTAASARVVQGQTATVSVTVRPAGSTCTLVVRYADGSVQTGLKTVKAVYGRATWRWLVKEAAGAGPARLSVVCTRAGSVAKTMMVVGAVEPPRVTVVDEGFSIRLRPTSAGISYGIVLANDSAKLDAMNVSVLVNFVDAANRVVGTVNERIAVVGAQQTFNVGGGLSFPAAAIVDHLETVIRVDGHRPRAWRVPAEANLRILPAQFEPAWVGTIEGEVINDHPQLFVRGARLSAVVRDVTGKIVGGSNGRVSSVLPPGAREFYKLSLSLSNIAIEKAVSASLSLEPSYTQA